MAKKAAFLFLLFALTTAVFAQSQPEHEDFWISLNVDGSSYSYDGISFGGGLSLGYGSGSSIGIKAIWYFSADNVNTFELNLIVRFYLQGREAYSGPFLQFMGGPVFYNYAEGAVIPAEVGIISAGLCFGWRFLFSDRWFVEPSIRAGFPYIAAAGVSAGVRF
jgi:hypothetical protein